jgi:hypothetical protein
MNPNVNDHAAWGNVFAAHKASYTGRDHQNLRRARDRPHIRGLGMDHLDLCAGERKQLRHWATHDSASAYYYRTLTA